MKLKILQFISSVTIYERNLKPGQYFILIFLSFAFQRFINQGYYTNCVKNAGEK